MSLEVEHTPRYWNGPTRLHWRTASDIGAAVLRFAAQATGLPSGRYAVRARGDASGDEVAVLIDRARGAVVAESVYRAQRRR